MVIDMVQELLVEVDSIKLLEQYLRLTITTALDAHEEIAVKIINREEKNLILHFPSCMSEDKNFPVILIEGWYIPKKAKKPRSYFGGYPKWKIFNTVDTAIEYIKDILEKNIKDWKEQFIKKFGDGYTSWFNKYDGSVGVGYGLCSCNRFPEWLAISLIHVYYGK